MDVMMFVLWFAVGFVFGSVPSGLWLVKAIHGIDIREYGSKNIGSTNVFRTVGGKTAALVLLCDAGKGIIAVMIAQSMTGGDLYAMLFAAIGALLGHNYSLFLGFKGGRGVATGLGLLIFLMPKVSGILPLCWQPAMFRWAAAWVRSARRALRGISGIRCRCFCLPPLRQRL